MIKLKPCPFCGSEMIQVERFVTVWVVHCLGCNTYGPGEHKTADQAAKAWNMRKGEKENEN